MVATGSDLKGGGVFSFIKAKGSPKNRVITGGVLAARLRAASQEM